MAEGACPAMLPDCCQVCRLVAAPPVMNSSKQRCRVQTPLAPLCSDVPIVVTLQQEGVHYICGQQCMGSTLL